MMSHQQLFEPVLTGEPPARDTLDALVRRSRRRVRRRRAAVAGGSLAAAGLAAVLILPGLPPPAVTGAPPSSSFSSSEPASGLLGLNPVEPLEAAVERLAAAVPAAVMQVAPGARVTGRPAVQRQIVPAAGGSLEETYAYVVTAVVASGSVTGALRVTMVRQYTVPVTGTCVPDIAPQVQPSFMRYVCAPDPGDIQPFTVQTHRDEYPGMIRNVARRDRADGSTVEVSVSNEPALTGNPPLTGEQAAEIARDPRLTLYP